MVRHQNQSVAPAVHANTFHNSGAPLPPPPMSFRKMLDSDNTYRLQIELIGFNECNMILEA